ncbi:transporter substrate-binding domain-containing protein [Catenovulum sp. SM1970]|uniref:substrate-binding periplasmic protein n=1 Tax=Marinifaba aquimaris TaxID=2741323 RepID=UPI001574199C|nr:transporter substrate-binding domain-containing protein [Marinifaba aquimaris]NTS76467.1 transporter substrate-binding domain-containing protein [Marinifaba aquimaris]
MLKSPVFLFLLLSLFTLAAQAKTKIKVGMNVHSPFYFEHGGGAGTEIIKVFNKLQDNFEFKAITVPVRRTPQALRDKWIDISMWDNPEWAEHLVPVTTSISILTSYDRFISKQAELTPVKIEQLLNNHTIALVHGYHYRFTDFETDSTKLNKRFNVMLVRDEEAVIDLIIQNRAQIGVLSDTTLNFYLKQHPEVKLVINVSKQFDTRFNRYFLIPEGAKISAKTINELIVKANKSGLLAPIYKKYALNKPNFGEVD